MLFTIAAELWCLILSSDEIVDSNYLNLTGYMLYIHDSYCKSGFIPECLRVKSLNLIWVLDMVSTYQ